MIEQGLGLSNRKRGQENGRQQWKQVLAESLPWAGVCVWELGAGSWAGAGQGLLHECVPRGLDKGVVASPLGLPGVGLTGVTGRSESRKWTASARARIR